MWCTGIDTGETHAFLRKLPEEVFAMVSRLGAVKKAPRSHPAARKAVYGWCRDARRRA